MNPTLDHLLAVLSECLAGYDDNDATLLGGLAVHVRLLDGRTLSVDAAMGDPTVLAAATRVTQDIDVCVRTRAAALRFANHLTSLGFALVPGRLRARRDEVAIDILTPEVPFAGIVFSPGMADPIRLQSSSAATRVAARAALFVTKSHAWSSRSEGRDLVDLARIAFSDLRTAELPIKIASLLAEEVQLWEIFRLVREQFETTSSRGPNAFMASLYAWIAGVETSQWQRAEQDVRQLVCSAMERMFADCDFDE